MFSDDLCGIFVKSVAENSAAAKEGRIQVNDQIIKVIRGDVLIHKYLCVRYVIYCEQESIHSYTMLTCVFHPTICPWLFLFGRTPRYIDILIFNDHIRSLSSMKVDLKAVTVRQLMASIDWNILNNFELRQTIKPLAFHSVHIVLLNYSLSKSIAWKQSLTWFLR